MKLDSEFIIEILEILENQGNPFYPVSKIAKEVTGGVCTIESHNHDPDGISCLNNKMVSHLLHLEDMGCITNAEGSNSWGYRAGGPPQNEQNYRPLIVAETWSFPHSYNAGSGQAVIRINAIGRQLLAVLKDDDVSPEDKSKALTSIEFVGRVFGRFLGGALAGAAGG